MDCREPGDKFVKAGIGLVGSKSDFIMEVRTGGRGAECAQIGGIQ